MERRQSYTVPTIEVIKWEEQDVITSSYDKAENDIFTDETGEWA